MEVHLEKWYREASGDKILFKNPWVSVWETPGGWVYVDAPPAVAVLPFRIGDNFQGLEFLLRFEEIPTMGSGMQPWMIFGGIEDHGSPEDAALAELFEEGGFRATEEDLIDLGEVWTRKDVSHPCRLFAVDVSDLEQVDPEGDGSEGESNFEIRWANWYEIIEHPVAVLHTLAVRLYARLYK